MSPAKATQQMFKSLWQDTRGIMLPYVTIMLVVLIGCSVLAVDGARFMSLQTQMQNAADALALAGARELDKQPNAITRATNAIDNLVANGLAGMGITAALTHSEVFYSNLNDASAGISSPGTSTAVDSEAKFVRVTIAPKTVPTIFPVSFLNSAAANSFSTGAQAIAGNAGVAICGIPPVYICNPYETAGMTDAQATSALRTALADPNTTRRQMRMDTTQTGTSGPGHFGYLVPPDGNNGASNLKDWIARTHPKTCYTKSGVDLNTGAMSSVQDAFNVPFDIYRGSLNYSVDYAPSVNVRKGYIPGSNGNWCVPQSNPNSPYYVAPIVNFTGTTQTGGGNAKTIINASSTAGLVAGEPISGTNIRNGTTIVSFSGTTITIDTNATGAGTVTLTAGGGSTEPLPQDSAWTGICSGGTCLMGNGVWDCATYWSVNHPSSAAPAGCTSSPSISRYDVYRYEIDHSPVSLGDWSGNGLADLAAPNNHGNGESGAPYCAGSGNGVDTSTGRTDRRAIGVAVINCLAQSGAIGGGQTANNIPVAGFAKFFMTQPIGALGPSNNYLYGEMVGQVNLNDNIAIMNEVQLYR